MLQGLPADQVSLLRALLPLYADGGGGGAGAGAEPSETAAGSAAPAAAGSPRAAFRRLHWHPEAWAGRERESWGPALPCFLRLLAEAEIPRPPTLEDLEGDIGRLECNGFTLSAPDRTVVGLGVYPSAAIGFNHDCSPNCRADAAGSNTALRVLAVRDIPAGEELRISYVDVGEPGPIRRRDLRQQYHFECGCGRCLADLSLGETSRIERSRQDHVDLEMAPVEMVDASKAWEVMDRLAGRADCNAVVLSPLPELARGSRASLQRWASRLCALGDLVEDTLYYWEGYKAEPSEPVRAQFCRQIRDDLEEMRAAVAEDAADEGAAASIGDPEAVTSLESLVTWLMDLYESGSGSDAGCGSESRGFALKLDINGKDSVAKFHDDWFTVRFEVALAGGGTVVAQNSSVDWHFWDECRGRMGMMEGSADEVERQIKAWNAKVCPPSGELALDSMSLCAMKGGGITNRPCIHRAPYSAAAGPRFLISLDKVTRAEMEKQRDMMDFDASEGSGSESEGGP